MSYGDGGDSSLEAQVARLERELNEAQSEVAVAAIVKENMLDLERQKDSAVEELATMTQLLSEATGVLVDTGALEGFAHKGTGTLGWDLPTDPWTLSVGLLGSVLADPLGSVAADPSTGGLGNAPRWSAGLNLAQSFDLRRGRLVLEVEGSWMTLLADGRVLVLLRTDLFRTLRLDPRQFELLRQHVREFVQ